VTPLDPAGSQRNNLEMAAARVAQYISRQRAPKSVPIGAADGGHHDDGGGDDDDDDDDDLIQL
jgi:hypothetical protein